jgi:hypothetical protein
VVEGGCIDRRRHLHGPHRRGGHAA